LAVLMTTISLQKRLLDLALAAMILNDPSQIAIGSP
jgi:hypothetical protein